MWSFVRVFACMCSIAHVQVRMGWETKRSWLWGLWINGCTMKGRKDKVRTDKASEWGSEVEKIKGK